MKLALLRLALSSLAVFVPSAAAQGDPPDPGSVEVLVVDEDGEGVFQVDLWLEPTEEELAEKQRQSATGVTTLETVKTDPDGFATLSVPSGETRTIQVRKRNEVKPTQLVVEPLEPGERRELEVTLITKPDLDVEARVVDAVTGEPLVGVEAHLSTRFGWIVGGPTEPLEVDDSPEAVTGPDGKLALRVRSWQGGQVTLVAPGRSPLLVGLANQGVARPPDPPVRMRKAGALRGVVTSAAGEMPSGLSVVVEVRGRDLAVHSAFGSFRDAAFTVEVDAEGRYAFEDLPSEAPLTVRVERGRDVLLRETGPRTLAAGETTVADLVLRSGASVSGVVRESDGTPAEGIEVWILRAQGRLKTFLQSYPPAEARVVTDADGRYRFEDVQTGEWTVGLAPARGLIAGPEEERYAPVGYAIELGSEGAEQDFVLHRGLYLEGRLETPSGEIFRGSGASVIATSEGFWSGNAEVSEGTFRLGPLVPGEWTLSASCWGRTGDERFFAPSPDVACATGGEPVVLRFRPGCILTARGVDPESGGPVEAQYSLFGTQKQGMRMGGGARELHEFTNLAPDTYTLVLNAPDGRFGTRTFELTAGDVLEDQAVELGPGGSVRIRCESVWPLVVVETFVDGQRIAMTSVPSGAERTLSGPAGEATLVFSEGGVLKSEQEARRVTRSVTLTPGSSELVEVRID